MSEPHIHCAPIIVFVYNRPRHTMRTLDALKNNGLAAKSDLFIFSDGARSIKDKPDVEVVREAIKNVDGFKTIKVTQRRDNNGLAKNIIQGVSEVIKIYGKAIIVEDDLITSPHFLDYMNHYLHLFEETKHIFSISGYTPPIQVPDNYNEQIYLTQRICSWGWATWKDRWLLTDWEVNDFNNFIHDKSKIKAFNKQGNDVTVMLMKQIIGKSSSWAIRFNYACFKNNGLCVYPVRSYIDNIGADGSGTHVGKTKKYRHIAETDDVSGFDFQTTIPERNEIILKNFAAFYNTSLLRRGINFFKLFRYRLRNPK